MHKRQRENGHWCKFFHTDHGWAFLQEPHKCFKILGMEAVIFAESVLRLGNLLAL